LRRLVKHLNHQDMPPTQRPPLSTGDLLGAVGIVAGIMSVELDLTWLLRTALVALAICLTVYAGSRHNSHPMVRIPIALAVIFIFSYSSWDAIAADFHKSFPLSEWPQTVRRPIFHFAVAAVASAALLSSRTAFSEWRRYVFFFRSRILSEQVWIDRATALALIKASDWAKTRDQRSPWGVLAGSLIGGNMNYNRDNIQYDRFIELTLKNFEKRGTHYSREMDGVKKYDESAIRQFLDDALTADTLKRFGDLPE
jgi:hypothetical protein